MKGKNVIKLDSITSNELRKTSVDQQITSDFILDLYERSKKLKGKDKKELLAAAEKLSKHIGKWLVE